VLGGKAMRIGDIIGFREDLFFEGAVQVDWFYNPSKGAKVASSFVFHGREYFGISDEQTGSKMTDTVSFLKIITNKIEDDQRGNPFTLAIAEYGTGKSHLAVTLAQVLSGKDYMPDTYKKVIDNIRRIDSETVKTIEGTGEKPNLVLAINGMRDFNLHYEILRAAGRSLRLYGYSDDNLKKLNRAHETAFRFLERNIDSNILLFEQKALDFDWHQKGTELAEKLRMALAEDKTAFDIINGVYEEINGHEIRWDEGVSANSVLETLLAEYCGISGTFNKIVIIFDEFGRYLEYASSANSAQSGDSALQQIFEAVQNADGNIQMINFIQSDIKAYLQRVDKTRNISRYIGRYDASDKYHLSSNLETVFANLIDRKDKEAFETYIKSWQKRNKDTWIDIYSKIDKWLPLKGLWKDKGLFDRVIVEGIYPLHPISTYMLTGLSGYLQNRSSLTLVNTHITALSAYELLENQECPLVLPEQLLNGDLYSEMLVAEQEGRQLSRHCIRYDNILRKSGDKFSENMCKVLRANLVLKLLRFRTANCEEAKLALSICSGLSVRNIEQELVWLENEYAVLGFDEHTGSFDFLEDSSGAHDFRTFYRRIKAGQTLSMSVFDNSSVREIAGVLTPLNTNFSVENKIKSNEWQFTQDLFHITEVSEAYIDSLISDFKNSTAPEKIKGQLIWLYINKDTDDKVLDFVQKLSVKTVGLPIVMFLLNDVENKLYSALLEYEVLTNGISNEEKNKFGRHYTDAFLQAENILKDTFAMLQRERLMIFPDRIKSLSNRLAVSLSDILNDIYSKIISFDFDGFDSKQPGRAKKSYCSILKLLLSGSINANTIQSSPVEVRNRFEATLFESGKNSWKCINSNYQIIPPKDPKVLAIYSYLEQKLKDSKGLNCKDIFDELSMPPYGLNDYIIVYLISVFCANLSYCIRPVYKKEAYSVAKWKDLIIGDNKVEVGMLKETCFILVDAGAVIDNYLRLFKRVEGNDDINLVNDYLNELQQLAQSEEIPAELEAQYKLCEYRLNEGIKILSTWNRTIDDLINKYEMAAENGDVYAALQGISAIENPGIYGVFSGSYVMSEQAKEQLKSIKNKLKAFVEPKLIPWIKDQRCYSVESMSQYKKHYKRIVSLLQDLSYFDEASFADRHGEVELQNREEIRERQELKANCSKFMSEKVITKFVAYTTLLDWEKQGIELLASIEKHKDFLGSDYMNLSNKISARVNEIVEVHNKIKVDMDDIWNDMYELSDIDMVESMIERIDYVCKKGIPSSDRTDFVELQKVLEAFISDTKELEELNLDREGFEGKFNVLYEKYSKDGVEIDILHILDSIADAAREKMNSKETEWIKTYILSVSNDISRAKALEWIERTINLPLYLSADTKEKYLQAKVVINKFLSDANIEDVLFHFRKLNNSEREICMEKLLDIIRTEC
jgi:hypothetical protein